MLSNTYHMMLCPGPDIVEQNGGLQKFTAWRGPMFTDSGGYQIFSMGYGSVSNEIKGNRCNGDTERNKFLQKIDEEGATFRSYVTGQLEKLTPERSIEVQRKLGADLVVVFDECTPFNVDKNYTADSMRRSHRWALRSLEEFKRTNTNKQALYGIIQGGTHLDLRDESTDFVNRNNFFGSAIGGSLGDSKRTMHDIVTYTRGKLRDDRPVHLLGIGGVVDIRHHHAPALRREQHRRGAANARTRPGDDDPFVCQFFSVIHPRLLWQVFLANAKQTLDVFGVFGRHGYKFVEFMLCLHTLQPRRNIATAIHHV